MFDISEVSTVVEAEMFGIQVRKGGKERERGRETEYVE